MAAAVAGETRFRIYSRRSKFLQQVTKLVIDLGLGGYLSESLGLGIFQLKDL